MAVSPLTLAPCPFFASASPAALQFAAAHMDVRHLRRREVLGDAAAPFAGLGVVLQGTVQAVDLTLDGKEVALMSVGPHEIFGHAGLLAQQPLALMWVAAGPSTSVAVMPRAQALQLTQFPELVLQVARLASQQVCDLLGWQKIQAIHPVGARVCAWLLHQGARSPELRLPTHAEMAWRLNTTRESVTRVLQKLLADGVLQRDGEVWHVAAPQALQEMARGGER